MSKVINVGEAKSTLSALLARVEHGESFVIARAGQAVATLAPVSEAPREFGRFAEFQVPRELLLEPMDDAEAEDWE